MLFRSVSLTASTSTLSLQLMGLCSFIAGMLVLVKIASPLLPFAKGVVNMLYPEILNLLWDGRSVFCRVTTS